MISLGIILDWIRPLSSKVVSHRFYPEAIKWIDASPSCADEWPIVLTPGVIIVCNGADEATALNESIPVIILGHLDSDDPGTELRNNTLFVDSPYSKQAFASLLQRRILDIREWEHELDRISAERGSYQEMLDASRDILGNLITMTDSAYRLIAYTSDMPTDDPVTNELIEQGFHGERALARFRETRAFAKWTKQRKTHYSEHGITPYPSMNYVFALNNTYFIQMVMTCTNVPYSQGLLNTFDILVSHIKAHIRRCQTSESKTYAKGTELLLDLIEGKQVSRKIIAQQMKGLGLTGKETGRLYAIREKIKDSENLEYLAGIIRSTLSGCYVLSKKDIIYIVVCSEKCDDVLRNKVESALSSLVNFSYVDVAVSGAFPALSNLNMASRQIDIAYKYGKGRPYLARDRMDRPDSFFRFENSLFDYLLFEEHRDIDLLKFCLRTSVLAHIETSDQKSPSDATVVRCYLKHECSLSLTAEALGVHRNTILNRIGSIAKRVPIDFADPKERLNLITLFHLSDFLEENGNTAR